MSKTSKRYVSKSVHWTMHIRPAITQVVKGDYGEYREIPIDPELTAEFQNLMLKSQDENAVYDRAFAARKFFPRTLWREGGGPSPAHKILGAIPSMTPQALNVPNGDGSVKLGMTSAYDPTEHFGCFYLDWEPNEKRRKEIEDHLDNHPLNGIEFAQVLLEAIELPWPSYGEMRKGQGADKRVLAFVKDLELAPQIVLEYEQAQSDCKAGIVARMEELVAEQAENAADEAALERVL